MSSLATEKAIQIATAQLDHQLSEFLKANDVPCDYPPTKSWLDSAIIFALRQHRTASRKQIRASCVMWFTEKGYEVL